ncbi:hypothetical protein P4H66_12910 [Paenibacillus dokdonensis]|uniref:Uncharacterized protein n=1 Tax=Paenibacillus dokdonensis TaxID=2567944 RepID=A0ABU6GMY8_9BACL|nr:hypothetical protein [Paenibacillus dokdonensis]MEC0240749.1 hypothetical protein [Paenibacillus dokdonensis]
MIQFLGQDGRSVSVWDYVILVILLLHCVWLILSLKKEPALSQVSGSSKGMA